MAIRRCTGRCSRKILQPPRVLLKAGANANDKTGKGYTPLIVAVLKKDFATVKVLLKAGANANAKDIYGYTPLHYAVWGYAVATAEVLLKAGADPNEEDFLGPYAGSTMRCSIMILRWLRFCWVVTVPDAESSTYSTALNATSVTSFPISPTIGACEGALLPQFIQRGNSPCNGTVAALVGSSIGFGFRASLSADAGTCISEPTRKEKRRKQTY